MRIDGLCLVEAICYYQVMSNIISLSALGNVFLHLAKTSPKLIGDFSANVHDVAAKLRIPPGNDREALPTASILEELFKPRPGNPIVGVLPTVLHDKPLLMPGDPVDFSHNPAQFLERFNTPDYVLSVSVDPTAPNVSNYYFDLVGDMLGRVQRLEVTEPSNPHDSIYLVSVNGNENKTRINLTCDEAARSLKVLLGMKNQLLKQQQAA